VSRRYDIFAAHVGIATRTSAGVATSPIHVGEYISGQLVLRIAGLGVGGTVRPIWQASADGVNFGNLAVGATAIATGTYILTPPAGGGVGVWARARWTLSGGTAAKFGFSYVFQE
jgi:hypothetical protein